MLQSLKAHTPIHYGDLITYVFLLQEGKIG